jgi:hypothetical protein
MAYFCILIRSFLGRFHPFFRPRRPLGRVGYSSILFLDLGTRRGWGVSVTPWPHSTPGKDPVPIVQEAGWAPGPVWTGAENLAPTGIGSPDRPARSQSLYRLSYPAHSYFLTLHKFKETYFTKKIFVYVVSVLRWLKYMFGMEPRGGAVGW